LLGVALSCGGSGGSGGGGGGEPSPIDVDLDPAFGGLTFDRAVKLVQHPNDANRWYVVQQGGEILTFLASNPAATLTTCLDLDPTVDLGSTTGNGEQGLLALAFDPDFGATTGGELYIAYTDDDAGEVILARYQSANATTFTALDDPLLALTHPLDNHNGGDLQFDLDGDYLFWSMGDGGGSGDPSENGQNRNTLLGTIMRLDVRNAPPAMQPYGIPAGNPFVGNPSCFAGPGTMPCPEIWAWGFRNPWRFGIDPMTGDMWVGEVGQAAFEEVDQVLQGLNYGWDCREGNQNFEFTGPCTTATLEPPEAVHPRTDARAITGGAVYRGTDIPELDVFFVYGDFATGNVWALDTTTDSPPRKLNLPVHNVAAFGQDVDGEIYLVTFSTPSIYALVPGDGG
jgi:glucose/arabinose dehydrogenase